MLLRTHLEQILDRPVGVLTTAGDFAYHDFLLFVVDPVNHPVIPHADAVDVVEQLATAPWTWIVLQGQHGLHDARVVGVGHAIELLFCPTSQ